MLWRSYNERVEPENDEIIKKGIRFAKRVILDYYEKKGEKHSQEVRAFIDNERAQETDELKYAFEFYNNKDNIGKGITVEDFKFIDDRILSAVKVYGKHLKKDRKNLVSEELEKEIRAIDKLFKKLSHEKGKYDLYTSKYDELPFIQG